MARDKYFYGIIFLQSCSATSLIFFKRSKPKMADKIYAGEWRKCRRKKFFTNGEELILTKDIKSMIIG